jgi:hypothetical protein
VQWLRFKQAHLLQRTRNSQSDLRLCHCISIKSAFMKLQSITGCLCTEVASGGNGGGWGGGRGGLEISTICPCVYICASPHPTVAVLGTPILNLRATKEREDQLARAQRWSPVHCSAASPIDGSSAHIPMLIIRRIIALPFYS